MDTANNPPLGTNQNTSSLTPPLPKSKSWLLIILGVLLGFSIVCLTSLAYQNYQLKNQLNQARQQIDGILSIIPKPHPNLTPTPKPLPTRSLSKGSEIISLDETWNKYINYDLGYSIKVPKLMQHFSGSCQLKEERGHQTYRPEAKLVSGRVFEDNDVVYIASEYYYQLTGETEEDGIHYYSECNKVVNSLPLLREDNFYQRSWKIITKEVRSDDELDKFIKENYGAGCKISQKNPSSQAGVFDISIDVGNGGWTQDCPINYEYTLKYYPEGNKAVTWALGQARTFWKDGYNYYDDVMLESFEFLE